MALLSKVKQPDNNGCIQQVTPARAGWRYVGFSSYLLKKGKRST